eukprot:767104-Hanusia_phi.AAC.4
MEPDKFASSALRMFSIFAREKHEHSKGMEKEQQIHTNPSVGDAGIHQLADWKLLSSTFEKLFHVGPLAKRKEKLNVDDKTRWWGFVPCCTSPTLSCSANLYVPQKGVETFLTARARNLDEKNAKTEMRAEDVVEVETQQRVETIVRAIIGFMTDVVDTSLGKLLFSDLADMPAKKTSLDALKAHVRSDLFKFDCLVRELQLTLVCSLCPTCCHIAKSFMSMRGGDMSTVCVIMIFIAGINSSFSSFTLKYIGDFLEWMVRNTT